MRRQNILVIGAAGNLGRRLVARGLARGNQVTGFVRDAARLTDRGIAPDGLNFKVMKGDALDAGTLAAAVRDHDVVINAAGNVIDGSGFSDLFKTVLAVVERELAPPKRFWALAGAAALTIPYAERIAVGLPGVPAMYRPHERNWKALEGSRMDWSLMCPGPMIAAPGGLIRSDLRISADIVPYHVPGWARWAPRVALSLLMKSRLPELIVSYEDVADIIMSHLASDGPFARRRVGVALPAGERGHKEAWTLGQRGGDS